MTDIYLYFMFAHYGLSGNAPAVVQCWMSSVLCLSLSLSSSLGVSLLLSRAVLLRVYARVCRAETRVGGTTAVRTGIDATLAESSALMVRHI